MRNMKEKIRYCMGCNTEKPIKEFQWYQTGKDQFKCNDCYRAYYRQKWREKRHETVKGEIRMCIMPDGTEKEVIFRNPKNTNPIYHRHSVYVWEDGKECTQCGIYKLFDKFWLRKDDITGRCPICRKCSQKYWVKRRQNNTTDHVRNIDFYDGEYKEDVVDRSMKKEYWEDDSVFIPKNPFLKSLQRTESVA